MVGSVCNQLPSLVLVAQSSPTLCDSMDCSRPGSSVYGILQARILEWVAIPLFQRLSQPRDQTQVSLTGGPFFTIWASTWLTPLATNSHRSVSSVQLLSHVQLFATPWIAARQASLSITNFRSSLRLTSIESVMPSSHLILCRPLLLLPPIPPSIRDFSNESTLHLRWPKYWSLSFSIILRWFPKGISLTQPKTPSSPVIWEISRVLGALCQKQAWRPNIYFLEIIIHRDALSISP